MPATATPGLLSGLPKLDELTPLLSSVGVQIPGGAPSPDEGKKATEGISGLKQQLGTPTVPAISGAPSGSGFREALSAPLSALTSVNGASLRGGLTAPLPIKLDAPPDLNGVIGQITTRVMPPGAVPQAIDVGDLQLAGVDEFMGPLRRLAEAGAATPLRMLQVMLAVLDKLVETATDVENLKRYTHQALQEILITQADAVSDQLPATGLARASDALNDDFVGTYQRLLDTLQQLDGATAKQLLDAVDQARLEVLLPLRRFDAAALSLGALAEGRTDALDRAAAELVSFPGGEAGGPLHDAFDAMGIRVEAVLTQIEEPVLALQKVITDLRTFLEDAVGQAGDVATRVTDGLQATLEKVATQLDAAQDRIEEVAAKIQEFFDRVEASVGPAIEAFKKGCATVVQAVDGVFTQVEEIREKLIRTTTDLEAQVDTRLRPALQEVRVKLEGFLDDIVGMLDRPEVKQVLDQARDGIEKLTAAINNASLSGVFDVVVDKTGELRTRVDRLDVSRLGTPQKTALKVGVKVIEAVKVDEIIRPELQDAFAQILDPLRELIDLLENNVLVVEREIDRFNPGSLITRELEPLLAPVFAQLEALKPSVLLAPIRGAIDQLTEVIDQLDPQKVLDEVQKAYAQVYELVKSLEPTELNATIDRAADQAVRQLTSVQSGLDGLILGIQQSISLERLLEGTGIQEVAQQAFWDQLKDALSGAHLDRITTTLRRVEEEIAVQFGGASYEEAAARLRALADEVDAQFRATPTSFKDRCNALRAILPTAEELAEMEARREALLAANPARPELRELLEQMSLQPLQRLLTVVPAVAGTALTAPLTAFKTSVTPARDALPAMTGDAISQAAPAIFRAQVSDPANAFVDRVRAKLEPISQVVPTIQSFVAWLTQTLPAELDRIVGQVIGTIRQTLEEALKRVIATIDTARTAVKRTIQEAYDTVLGIAGRINPGLVLNRFGVADLELDQGDEAFARLYAMARRIVQPDQDEVAVLLRAGLARDAARLAVVEGLVASGSGSGSRAAAEPASGAVAGGGTAAKVQAIQVPAVYGLPRLTPDQRTTLAANVVEALNQTLGDRRLTGLAAAARTRAAQDAAALQVTSESVPAGERVAARKRAIRAAALRRQLGDAQTAYDAGPTPEALYRLNRVILEVNYPDVLPMALQGIHAFVVAQVGALYPEEAVQSLDRTHAAVVGILRDLPRQMIQEPLDAAFDKVKDKLHTTFDLAALFGALNGRVDSMEGELSDGLDRLSAAYKQLLGTLDARLSG